MKKNSDKDLHNKTIDELRSMLKELEGDIVTISISQKIGKMKNVALMGNKKKRVAQILTILKEKEQIKV